MISERNNGLLDPREVDCPRPGASDNERSSSAFRMSRHQESINDRGSEGIFGYFSRCR